MPPPAGGDGGGGGGGGGGVHVDRLIVLLSNVTAPLRASARPRSVAPAFIVMEVSARMFPANSAFVPMVAELPTCQNTLQDRAPLMNRTWLPEPTVSVGPA